MKQVNNVVIFHIGRCGSSILSSMLNQNPMIQSEGEIFHRYMKDTVLKPDIYSILNDILKNNKNKIKIFEIKFLKSQQLSLFNIALKDIIKIFIDFGFTRFIILQRANYLNRMISHCIAQETNAYYLRSFNTPVKHPIVLNIDEIKIGLQSNTLIEWFKIFDESYHELNELLIEHPKIELNYELDIEHSPIHGYKKVCDFLDISDSPVNIPFKKMNPFPINEILLNYEEIYTLISKTQYRWMLE